MNYTNQFGLIVSFIGLRLLTLVLYLFFQPAVPGLYTPYILFLYTVFDVLIICYLYRFVKGIKQQKISLIAVLLISISITCQWALNHFFPYESSGLTPRETVLRAMPFYIASITGQIIIAVQLIRNKAAGRSGKYIHWLGWAFILRLVIGLVFPFLNLLMALPPEVTSYISQLSFALPLIVMMAMYLHELKHPSDLDSSTENSIVDADL